MERWTASVKWVEGPALDGQRGLPLALRLSAGLGLTGCHHFDFDSVRVFTVESVVARATGVRVLVVVESGVACLFDPGCYLVYMRARLPVERNMVQADSLAVVAGRQVFLGGPAGSTNTFQLLL